MKTRSAIAVCILLLLSSLGQCQNNAIKIGFTDALIGNFNLSYERMVDQSQSLQIKIGYFDPALSPVITEQSITPSAYELKGTNGGINASLDYRFYGGGKNFPRGLYIAPYLRYLNQSIDYYDEIDARDFMVDFRLNTIGAGAQLGYQMILAKMISLDIYFFGAGIDYHIADLKYRLRQPEPGFDYGTIVSDVNDVFKDISYLHKRLDNKVNDDSLDTKLPFFFPGFRIGMSVGVVF